MAAALVAQFRAAVSPLLASRPRRALTRAPAAPARASPPPRRPRRRRPGAARPGAAAPPRGALAWRQADPGALAAARARPRLALVLLQALRDRTLELRQRLGRHNDGDAVRADHLRGGGGGLTRARGLHRAWAWPCARAAALARAGAGLPRTSVMRRKAPFWLAPRSKK